VSKVEKKVLLVRCAPEKIIQKIIEQLSEKPISVTLLVQEDRIDAYGPVEKILYSYPRFTVLHLSRTLVKNLRDAVYDEIIIPCSNNSGTGYLNVRFLTWVLKTKCRILWLQNGRQKRITYFTDVLDAFLSLTGSVTRLLERLTVPILYGILWAVYRLRALTSLAKGCIK